MAGKYGVPVFSKAQFATLIDSQKRGDYCWPMSSSVFGLLLGFAAMYCVQAFFKFLKSTLLERKKKSRIEDSEKQQVKLEHLEWQKNRMHSALVYDRDRIANGNGETSSASDEVVNRKLVSRLSIVCSEFIVAVVLAPASYCFTETCYPLRRAR